MSVLENSLEVDRKYPSLLVIGGTGFIGSHLVAQLSARDYRVLVPTRHEDSGRHLLVLPNVDVVEADVHEEAQLRKLMDDVDAVINLVGILHGKPAAHGAPYGADFARAHVELPKKIVAACAATGITRLLHMSALGADRDAPSMYLRSKADGEAAVSANPAVGVTIFRPAVVFGEGDHFLNMFANLQKMLPVIPLGGAETKFQPVFVGDVASAYIHALENDHTIGHVYELAGPQVYTLRELVELAGEISGHPHPVVGLPPALARLQAWFLEHAPGGPIMSRDNLDSMRVDNVARLPIAPELEITPTPLEAVVPAYLARDVNRVDLFREKGRRE
ncbi:complex I NDUFA9 subunit family protein [Noviherbaspirillum sedimenti]|uniref:Complex I NDUFA9 subunit family protein n=1 Tax=Noviherbaspirillum sedimenti TaxID=2320865 RepID=A0A3A3G4L8_9BURK|nr:complex I NDUFA9 subunit family protein [Noviherbaspirillum sedimenti]RJG03428.1 complex I NDUFA9 subunit family protein [Noviherbaspirillum sedimenti]